MIHWEAYSWEFPMYPLPCMAGDVSEAIFSLTDFKSWALVEMQIASKMKSEIDFCLSIKFFLNDLWNVSSTELNIFNCTESSIFTFAVDG